MTDTNHFHLAVALDGAGWHPAAWRAADAQPGRLFTGGYWADLAARAEGGLLDLLTIEDALTPATDHHAAPHPELDRVVGRLDAGLIASRISPVTEHIGLVPTVVAPLTEPFHISKAIATLDYTSRGRAGVRVRTSSSPQEFANIGRREAPALTDNAGRRVPLADLVQDLFGEVADYIEVIRRLWDSWEDDAEIRDVATGRFVDIDRLHYIDFAGANFSVRGPSITPRPPQGQPPVVVLGHTAEGHELIGRSADIGIVTPFDLADARSAVTAVREAAATAGRDPEHVKVLADLVVFLAENEPAARARLDLLDSWSGSEFTSDADVFVGSADQLVERLLSLGESGIDGFRLRPGTVPHDLGLITDTVVPALQRAGVFRERYTASTLRGHFDLPRPANRYAAA